MLIKTKRVYDAPDTTDGFRVLVDRLWPRGMTKAKARIDLWLKEIAPSHELRTWYAHDPNKWTEFRTRYWRELDHKQDVIETLIEKAKRGSLTLLFSSREEKINNAVALRAYIRKKAKA